MSQKQSTRQLRQHAVLPMLGNAIDETGDILLARIDAELAKLFEDRNSLLTDGGIVTFTGTQVQFTESLKISLNSKISGAAPQVFDLGSTTRSLSASGRMIYAVLDRSTGLATIFDDATTLAAVTSANQEVFLIAKRVDATDGTQRIYFRNGCALNAGQSVRLGAAGSGGGSGTGDDIGVLTFKASFTDGFEDIPTAANSAVDTTAGKTDSSLYSAVSAMFQLAYDATKTVTGTGVNMTMSAAPSFTVKIGDMLISGGQARRIATVTSQTVYVLESAFTTNPTAQAATVSQAVHTKDLNNFTGDGLAISSAFATTINQILMSYEDTSAAGDKIYDANSIPVVAYTASSDGTNYSPVSVRPTNLSDTFPLTSLPTAGTNLYMRMFANKSSGSGTVNVLGYKVFFHRDSTVQDGSILNQASALTNGAGTQVNIASLSVLGGKTTLKTSFSFPVGVNVGKANGALTVWLNGQKVPRFISATATPDASYTEIDANTIQLDRDYSSLNLLLEVIQDVAVIDVSDTNVTSISQMQETSSEAFQGFVKSSQLMNATSAIGAPAVGSFHSTIINRAALPDFTQDLKVRMGIERLNTQGLTLIQNEVGPNGELVYGCTNDETGLIRFVGNWQADTGTFGRYVYPTLVGSYVEITFYGTGLNVLCTTDGSTRDYRASINGGAEGINIYSPGTSSGVLGNRNYTSAAPMVVASGLTLGVHTVKIRLNSGPSMTIGGFEILNESSSVKVQAGVSYIGGKKLVTTSQQTLTYNSAFESGILGTRGGRVVVYQKADGTIAKAVQPANASQANLTAADHTNEEVIRRYNQREFSAARLADDFGQSFTTSNRVFTLDDGTTTLIGNAVINQGGGSDEHIRATGAGGFLSITFVGTGLDIIQAQHDAVARVTTINVDGINVGTISTAANEVSKQIKIVSGLPYGTHTVRFIQNTNDTVFTKAYVVYGPKKPTVPAGAVELADYNIMADFVATTTPAIDTVSTGVLRKMATREMVYVEGTGGTQSWTVGSVAPASQIAGFQLITDRQNAYVEYVFFGTGFDLRYQSATNRSPNIPITLNGLAATTANFPGLNSTGLTGSSFNVATGLLTMTASTTTGSGVTIKGLPLGTYKLRMTNPSTGLLPVEAIDIHTPIHSPKSNEVYAVQNTLPIGSCAISDNRKLSIVKNSLSREKNSTQSVGVVSSPTTSATFMIPIPDMSGVIRMDKAGRLKISYSIMTQQSAGGAATMTLQVFVNGIAVSQQKGHSFTTLGYYATQSDVLEVPVGAGVHKVDVQWMTNGGTMLAVGVSRNLLLEEK